MDKRRELISEFRIIIKGLPKVPEGSPFKEYEELARLQFNVTQNFLLDNLHHSLIANDCCGRGLPSYRYASLSRLHGFKMDETLEAEIMKVAYLRVNALNLES